MTQFFFDVDHYRRLVDELAALGCDQPVVAGVMPFVSVPGLRRMAAMNRTDIPSDLVARASSWWRATPPPWPSSASRPPPRLCAELADAGAPGIHLYTLNRSASVRRIWDALA